MSIVNSVDSVFWGIFAISALVLIGIVLTIIYFSYKYSRTKNQNPKNIHGNVWAEIIWTVIPTIIFFGMFYYGYEGFKLMRNVPDDAIVVKVIGRTWEWSFEYANGKKSKEMVVPAGKPIKALITSSDVLHSFSVPAFRVKEDALPNKWGYVWFQPEKPGRHDIFCAEYCGMNHSYMLSKLVVMEQGAFDEWYSASDSSAKRGEITAEDDLVSFGETLSLKKGCVACHTTDGSVVLGPSYKGLFGKKEIVIRGGKEVEVTVDSAYLRSAIKNPAAELVKGFQPLMPPVELTDKEVLALIEYIKSVK